MKGTAAPNQTPKPTTRSLVWGYFLSAQHGSTYTPRLRALCIGHPNPTGMLFGTRPFRCVSLHAVYRGQPSTRTASPGGGEGRDAMPWAQRSPSLPRGARRSEATSLAGPRACKRGKREARSAFPSGLSWLLHIVSTGLEPPRLPLTHPLFRLDVATAARSRPGLPLTQMGNECSPERRRRRRSPKRDSRGQIRIYHLSLSPAHLLNGRLNPPAFSEVQPSTADVISAER